MTKLINFRQIAIAAILFAGCNTASTDNPTGDTNEKTKPVIDLPAAKSTIESANQKFMDAFKKGDSAAVASFYTSDGSLMPPNSESVKRADISSAWGSFMRLGVKDLKLMTDDVYGNGDLLSETGRYEIYGAENKLWDSGKYIVLWKQENGDWKLFRDIWNSNMPAAPVK